ncbi:hypothetical protein SISNIDRAFT_487263 [Sistotremastrum niveocremeum HHB9708]|uniref:DUF6535 domain-containing protein n=1 Tax=Sistotremastrum niveocremeum HHB9708 TaxID=1314777 RepID=A0A164SLA5_9AGAM|nr:hypothetical protein SISNIDRAFT_487263 [Sistotremastrum niveocremeum HHB9708]
MPVHNAEQVSAGIPSSNVAEALLSQFERLLALTERQNSLLEKQGQAIEKQGETLQPQTEKLEEQHSTMKKHTEMLDILDVNATKDDRAHDGRTLEDEQTWGALDKEALAKIKIVVDEWRDLMQISLVFIALFLTVVTAFISPIIQLFTSPSSDDDTASPTQSPLPPWNRSSTQHFPLGKTNLERTLARERRKVLADGYMLPLMGLLFWTLLLSIGLFVVGFLIQLWQLAFSFGRPAPILIVGGVLATGLSLLILGIVIATTIHAALHVNSPFESPLSNAMKPTLRWISQHFGRSMMEGMRMGEADEKGGQKYDSEGSESGQDPDRLEALIKWNDKDSEVERELKTYARLAINTGDAELLDRISPSFDFAKWSQAGESLFPIFKAIHARFLATDTSFRVKETTHMQLIYFRKWSGWTNGSDGRTWWNSTIHPTELTSWCKAQFGALVNQSHDHHRKFFPSFVFFTSLEEGNRTLRGQMPESYEESLSRILCMHDRDIELGEQADVFYSAFRECDSLVRDGRLHDITTILSGIRRSFLLRSLLKGPHQAWDDVKALVSFITEGNEIDILNELSRFLSNLSNVQVVHRFFDVDVPIINFLELLRASLPFDFTVPDDLDLSALLTILVEADVVQETSETVFYYLHHGGFERLSDLQPAWEFWQNTSPAPRFRRYRSGPGIQRSRFQFYHECFVPLPRLSDEELNDLSLNICALLEDRPLNHSTKHFKGPILELIELPEQHREDVVRQILSKTHLQDFISFLIQKSNLKWSRLESLVSLVVRGRETELLNDMSDFIGNPSAVRDHACYLRVLDFFAQLIPLLPLNFTVSHSFDMFHILDLFDQYGPYRQTWRKHSDTIMFYLNHGAFERLDWQGVHGSMPLKFFRYCAKEPERMARWPENERVSEQTKIDARRYLERLSARDAPELNTLVASGANNVLPSIEPSQPMSLRARVIQRVSPQSWRSIVGWRGDRHPRSQSIPRISEQERGNTALHLHMT